MFSAQFEKKYVLLGDCNTSLFCYLLFIYLFLYNINHGCFNNAVAENRREKLQKIRIFIFFSNTLFIFSCLVFSWFNYKLKPRKYTTLKIGWTSLPRPTSSYVGVTPFFKGMIFCTTSFQASTFTDNLQMSLIHYFKLVYTRQFLQKLSVCGAKRVVKSNYVTILSSKSLLAHRLD